MNKIVVLKFGGSSVADDEKLNIVAQKVIEYYKNGNEVVVVLSAQGKTTDKLIKEARTLSKEPNKREESMLVSVGEQISIAKLGILLNELGYNAISLTGWQAGIKSNDSSKNAIIEGIEPSRIYNELNKGKIVIIAGFQAIDENNDISTLGRGGSDTTAVALAAALHADACEIYTDVDGVYTADPRIVKNARKLSEITYDEMLDLAASGAGVLHNRSVEMAKKYGVTLVVRSSLNESEGTSVKEEVGVERMLITGVALDKNASRISVMGLKDEPGIAFKLFNTLAKNNINVDIILQSIGRENTKDISFTVNEDEADETIEILKANKSRITFQEVTCKKDVAKVSIVGAGMMSNPGVAATMFEALYNENININMISTSEIRITVLVNEKDGERAMNAVHEAFGLAEA